MKTAKKSMDNPTILAVRTLLIYAVFLILYTIRFKVDLVWWFFGAIPSGFAIYLAVYWHFQSKKHHNSHQDQLEVILEEIKKINMVKW